MHFGERDVERCIEKLMPKLEKGEMADDAYEYEYNQIAGDIDAAMQAALKAAVRPNVGFARSPALTDAASIVRYWRHQLSANRNRIGHSTTRRSSDLTCSPNWIGTFTFVIAQDRSPFEIGCMRLNADFISESRAICFSATACVVFISSASASAFS